LWKLGKLEIVVWKHSCSHTISRFPNSTRVDITVYQHGKCFIFVNCWRNLLMEISSGIFIYLLDLTRSSYRPSGRNWICATAILVECSNRPSYRYSETAIQYLNIYLVWNFKHKALTSKLTCNDSLSISLTYTTTVNRSEPCIKQDALINWVFSHDHGW
jgi:hypothetical protein